MRRQRKFSFFSPIEPFYLYINSSQTLHFLRLALPIFLFFSFNFSSPLRISFTHYATLVPNCHLPTVSCLVFPWLEDFTALLMINERWNKITHTTTNSIIQLILLKHAKSMVHRHTKSSYNLLESGTMDNNWMKWYLTASATIIWLYGIGVSYNVSSMFICTEYGVPMPIHLQNPQG